MRFLDLISNLVHFSFGTCTYESHPNTLRCEREVKDVIKHEFLPKESEKIEFELKEEESDSTAKESDSTAKEESEDEEPQTPSVRRLVRERR